MTWARLEGRYPQSRKVRPLSDAAFRADVEGICWSNEEGTDGRITAEDLQLMGDGKRKPRHATELVRRGRWHTADDPPCPSERCPHDGTAADGWVIHDFLDYNPTAVEVARERAAKKERQKRWRDKKTGRYAVDASHDTYRNGSRDTSRDSPRDGPHDALGDATPHRPAPPRSEGSGGGAPPSDPGGSSAPPAASSAGGAAGGRNDQQRHPAADWPTDDPQAIAAEVAAADAARQLERKQLADSTRRGAAAVRAAIRQQVTSGRRPSGAALAELREATPDVAVPTDEDPPPTEGADP